MKTVEVEICGTSPLLIHRFSEASEQAKSTRRMQITPRDPRAEAEKVAYIAPDGTYYFSAFSIPNAMGNAGSNHKMLGSRKSLRFVVPSAVRMTTDAITILNGDEPAKSFEVDARPVTIPATKGRIMRYRPRFDSWNAKFNLLIEEDALSIEDAHLLLEEAGRTIGVGDFRPEKRGPFGCFRVVKFKEAAACPKMRLSAKSISEKLRRRLHRMRCYRFANCATTCARAIGPKPSTGRRCFCRMLPTRGELSEGARGRYGRNKD